MLPQPEPWGSNKPDLVGLNFKSKTLNICFCNSEGLYYAQMLLIPLFFQPLQESWVEGMQGNITEMQRFTQESSWTTKG